GVTGGSAGNGFDAQPIADGHTHDADEHGHPEVLEGPGVAVATKLDPQVRQTERSAVPLRPEEIRAALVHRHDHVVGHLRHHPLALAPHARSVRPPVLTVAVVEDAHPARATPIAQSVEVVHDLEQAAATRTTVDGLSDRPRTRAARKAA